MDTSIKIFSHPVFGDVRIITNEHETPLFIAKDIAVALGYSDTMDAIARHCKTGTKVFHPHANGIGGTHIVAIKESDIYRLIMRSNLPQAEQFQDWVFDEVLPSIRKTGGYIIAAPEETSEMIMARAILVANDTIERLKSVNDALAATTELQAKELKESAPKAKYHDDVLNSTGLISATELANELGFSSAKSLNTFLKSKHIIRFVNGCWALCADYSGKGFAKYKTHPYTDNEGNVKTSHHLYWTETGRKFLLQFSRLTA